MMLEIKMENLFIVFEHGDRGPICKLTPDFGAWIAPVRGQHVECGNILHVALTGTSPNGRLRFACVLKDITKSQKTALKQIEKAGNIVSCFKELVQRSGDITVAPLSSCNPWIHSYLNHSICLDEQGRPSVDEVQLQGPWVENNFGDIDTNASPPRIKLKKALPLERGDMAQQVLASAIMAGAIKYNNHVVPTWGEIFVERIAAFNAALIELETRKGFPCFTLPKGVSPYAEMKSSAGFWLLEEIRRLEIFELRMVIENITIPLEAVQAEVNLLYAYQPTHVRFKDGREQKVSWVGGCGEIWVDHSIFRTVELDLKDVRTIAIKKNRFTLRLTTSREEREETEGYSAGQAEEVTFSNDSRQLI